MKKNKLALLMSICTILTVSLLTACGQNERNDPSISKASDFGSVSSDLPADVDEEKSSAPNRNSESNHASESMESPSTNMPVGESANVMEKNWDVLEGKWYYFRRAASPDEGINQHLFSFDEDNPKRIVWSIGYLESEGINTYEGVYEIDEDG